MTKVESKPDALTKAKSSHGFPCLNVSGQVASASHVKRSTASVCVALDGGLAEARRGNEIGSPIPEALEFLADVTAAGIDVQISTHRPQSLSGTGYESTAPAWSPSSTFRRNRHHPASAISLDMHIAIDDTYPTVEELSSLMQPSEENAPTVESAFGR